MEDGTVARNSIFLSRFHASRPTGWGFVEGWEVPTGRNGDRIQKYVRLRNGEKKKILTFSDLARKREWGLFIMTFLGKSTA
jgi:hypothetical protein